MITPSYFAKFCNCTIISKFEETEAQEVARKFIIYKSEMHRVFKNYFYWMVIYAVFITGTIGLIDYRLQFQFVKYGSNLFTHTLSTIFPTDSICDLPVSETGETRNFEARCSVPLNYYYSTYFVLVWWYFATVLIMYVIMGVFWVLLSTTHLFRARIINFTSVISSSDYGMLRKVCIQLSASEFFVLEQILRQNDLEFNSNFLVSLYGKLYPD